MSRWQISSLVALLALVGLFVVARTPLISATHGGSWHTIERVSIASDGTQGNGNSISPFISSDGRFVTFNSFSSNLVLGDTNGTRDVFVHDRLMGKTTRVSVASDGTEGNGLSFSGAISDDGRFVVFDSFASNLVPDDTNGVLDAFVHDRDTDNDGVFDELGAIKTTRVSVASDGSEAKSISEQPDMSADGRFVAFRSLANNLVAGDTNGWDVFVHDRDTDNDGVFDELGAITTVRVSVASDGTQANDESGGPRISGDGRFVTFDTHAYNLVPGDTNGVRDVFVHDLLTRETTRVSVASDGTQGNADSSGAHPSVDGRIIGFHSWATNLVPGDTNGARDVFVHDQLTGETTRVSVASDGTQGNGSSQDARPTHNDGRFVAFHSFASNLVPGDTNGVEDEFVHDRLTGETTRVSVASDGTEGNGSSSWGWLSADGRLTAFQSSANNLVPGDTNSAGDIFVAVLDGEGPIVSGASGYPNPVNVNDTTVLTATVDDSSTGGSEITAATWFERTESGDGPHNPMTASDGSFGEVTEVVSTTISASELGVGVHEICVYGADSAGNNGLEECIFVIVYDPAGGFATGGGWFIPGGPTSDSGDILPGLDNTSRAEFGFVVKYKPGATIPDGQLEFQYRQGDFNLHSSGMDWLVVNDNWAKFQGQATIGGRTGEFPFRVDVRDGNSTKPDRFVIKVWLPATNPDIDNPIYKASGDLQGGNILIHTK